jgi:hypothetical protein
MPENSPYHTPTADHHLRYPSHTPNKTAAGSHPQDASKVAERLFVRRTRFGEEYGRVLAGGDAAQGNAEERRQRRGINERGTGMR